jgi:hypothetical protein
VEVDVTAGDQVPLGLLHGTHYRPRMRQVEGASGTKRVRSPSASALMATLIT